jgi:DNA-binding Lrp family transcriptional regulator
MVDSYRGYLLIRLARIGSEWEISERMMAMNDPKGDWEVTFASPIYGSWDVLVEISFKKLEDLDTVVTALRSDDNIRDSIEETTTLVSSRANYDDFRAKYKKNP